MIRKEFGISLKLVRNAVIGAMVAIVPLTAPATDTVFGKAAPMDSAPRLTGQVPYADQISGRALMGYTQGTKLVGHNNIFNRRQNGNLGWVDDCAYVSAYFGSAIEPLSGLAVLDVSKPKNPVVTQMWTGTPGARESQVEGNQDSRMVVVMPFPRATFFGDPEAAESLLQFYDVPQDCGQLVKRGTYHFGVYTGPNTTDRPGAKIFTHEHRIWRDFVYVTSQSANDPGPPISVIYAGNRDNPILIATWDLSDEGGGMPNAGVHDLDISPDGTRLYLNMSSARPGGGTNGGLAILDTTEVANWRPGMPAPVIRRISDHLVWTPPATGNTHTTIYFKVHGRKYAYVSNEGGGCPAAYGQIVDVNFEAHPVVIASVRLPVSMVENCPLTRPDHAGFTLGDPGGKQGLLSQYQYGAHYAGIDDPDEATTLATTWYSAGLHLWDVSDPYNPKWVGEFQPPAIDYTGEGRAVPDRTYSFVRFHKGNIWFTSAGGGFWVIKQTNKRGTGTVN
jgi:hypothetical protein